MATSTLPGNWLKQSRTLKTLQMSSHSTPRKVIGPEPAISYADIRYASMGSFRSMRPSAAVFPIGSMFVSLHVVDAMRICSQVVLSAVGRSEVLHA